MVQTIGTQLETGKLQGTPSIRTSLVDVSKILSTKNQLPCRVFFKFELEQPSGSFKLRGIGHLVHQSILDAKEKGETNIHVVASSGGNAGLAAAYSAKYFNVECTVIVPSVTMPHILDRLRSLGAKVIIHGETISEASQCAEDLIHVFDKDVHAIYCHPFDNSLIWEGHSVIIDEVFEQISPEDANNVKGVVCSVGGGGLYNGIIEGLKKNHSNAECLLVETKQAPTMSTSVKAGTVIELDSVKSIATSLACSYVPKKALDNFLHCPTNKSHVRAIDDLEAVKGCLRYYKDFGKCIEPACGAAVSSVYNQLDYLKESMPHLSKDDIVVVIVCGGSCTNEETLHKYRKAIRQHHI